MKQGTYAKLVNTYGITPSRWPEDARSAALSFAKDNPQVSAELSAQAKALDVELNQNTQSMQTNTLLMARILKTASKTPQDPIAENSTSAVIPTLHSQWKQLAATLLIMTPVGFAAAQILNNTSTYRAAEQLLALNQDIDSNSNNWPEILP